MLDSKIAYLASLIEILGNSGGSKRKFTKGLILIGSGITPDGVCVNQIPSYDPVLKDWIENFRQLYPQYFNAVHPAFVWVSGVVFEQQLRYNTKR